MQKHTTNSNPAHKPARAKSTPPVDVVLTESALQQQCVMWFKNTFRPIRKLLYMNHNSGRKTMMSATTDIGLGLTKGVPDLFLAIPTYWQIGDDFTSVHLCGLYLEAKTPKGRLSPEQSEMIALLKDQNYGCEVFTSLEQFQRIVLDHLKNSLHRYLLEA